MEDMETDPSSPEGSAIDRWDQLHEVLASQERRMILYSLKDAPKERRLPLPEAAKAPDSSWDSERAAMRLEHSHLPKLAAAGYVRWERDPFCVQRGRHFEEVEAMFNLIDESIDRFPKSLITGCDIYEELYHDVRQ
ncbi:hypothetical protein CHINAEXTREME_12030 [Halobiforma lacisalsi AJ5]|uniref:DUF7344 domain-containing protein n=2 Tax=Natronobacterium lacisalsi TaxID=229731 RepID=M0LI84_NATLA|nr:hypothetical protein CHINAEXTREME_12030 [Halobiforma lacisalsi AJ5]EMA33236.1 hypothetical protein C445_09318 [Halobiforma lacisalsi AJ5]